MRRHTIVTSCFTFSAEMVVAGFDLNAGYEALVFILKAGMVFQLH